MELISFSDIVEENGKTVRENNLEKEHAIPIGTLVEARWDEWFGDGACWMAHARLFVVRHDRDCDGTPLYALSKWASFDYLSGLFKIVPHCGFSEGSLTVVPVTDELIKGVGALEWPESEWTDEWPTEPGEYWFYGWDFGISPREPEPPSMSLVEVRRGGGGSLFFVSQGHFIYKDEAIGKWTLANKPEPPEMDKADGTT